MNTELMNRFGVIMLLGARALQHGPCHPYMYLYYLTICRHSTLVPAILHCPRLIDSGDRVIHLVSMFLETFFRRFVCVGHEEGG